jgi:hypothetical protein
MDLPLHHREQGWIIELEASSLSSQKEFQDSAVSKESDGFCFLGCSRIISYGGLDKFIYHYDKSLNRLGGYVEE